MSYPKALHDGWLGSRFLLLESPAPCATNQAPRKLGEAHVRATNELARIRSVSMPLADSQLWRTAAATEALHEPRASGWLLKRLIDLVGQRFGGDALVFHPYHGDFTPWNSALTPSGLYLFDWEYARWEAPAGWDLVHFAMQTGHLIKHLRAEKLVKFVRCELARLSNYKWREAITDDRLNRLMLIYAAVQLAFYLREDPESHTNVKLYSSIATTLIDGEDRA